MFKNILPSKRVPSSDFTMITPLRDADINSKENQPHKSTGPAKSSGPVSKGFAPSFEKRKRANTKGKDEFVQVLGMNQAFDKLLDDLQIPSTVRQKLEGMDATVKAAMVKSSHILTLPRPTPDSPPHTPRATTLRRARSTESFGSPGGELLPPRPAFVTAESMFQPQPGTPRKSSGHSRNLSFDSPGLKSRSQISLLTSSSVLDLTKTTKEKSAPLLKTMSPLKIIGILTATSSTQIDVETVKKLRLLLRNESANWTQEFLRLGGYGVLVTRLNEILEVEWREEQHDDQVLHELLRCFKALSTSSIGCFALRSSCPTPFVQLVALLYSDKKPGDVPTRQLIVELILILFDIYPVSSLPCLGNSSHHAFRSEIWDTEDSTSGLIRLPSPHKNVYSLIRALLLTPAPPPSESPAAPVSPHEFIESLHRPRVYKTYLQELSDVCRDYFWVFCHPNNKIWLLSETDESRVEKPRAPGGMTGGVEFEAVGYFITHLKLVNAICKSCADLNLPKDNDLSAYRLHADLFLSGFERIILISRKASTTYYPTLHLELARYVAHAAKAGYDVPYNVVALLGLPPSACSKNGTTSGRNTPSQASPTKRGLVPVPVLPSPRKFEPIRIDK
ncbi:armadillo-type protein [Mycena floridula]|nr:armadillo-type protein [Mycena floridula]